jgi:hypothetical protein
MNQRQLRNRLIFAGGAIAAGWCCLFAVNAIQVAQAEPAENQAQPVPVATARDRAKVMHDVYSATLDVMHDRYFHGDRATVPARALEDVFAEMARQSKIEARWISVNTRPMSIGHEPKGDFEKRAAKEIAAGKTEYELIDGGVYRRAAPIQLHASCVNCHVGLLAEAVKTQRYAGLIISMPVSDTVPDKTASEE